MGTRKNKESKIGDKEWRLRKTVQNTASGLQCELCDLWYLTKCQKVSDDMFVTDEKIINVRSLKHNCKMDELCTHAVDCKTRYYKG